MGSLETWCLLSFRGSAYCDTSADGFGTFPNLRRRISPQSTTADGQNVLRCSAAEFGRRSLLALPRNRSAQSQVCQFPGEAEQPSFAVGDEPSRATYWGGMQAYSGGYLPLYSRRHDFAKAAIAASRMGSCESSVLHSSRQTLADPLAEEWKIWAK